VLLAVPQPYDFDLSLSRFRDFGNDGATVWHEDGIHRVVDGVEVRGEPAAGGIRIDPGTPAAATEISRLVGLPFDLEPFRAWAASDAILGPIVERLAGFRPTLNPRAFEALVVAITTQQISLRAAAAIRGRLVRRFGTEHAVAWEFPTRERIAATTPDEIVAIGFSRSKAAYLVGLARSGLDLDGLASLPDDEVAAAITAHAGLGEWTADWFLARHLARPHAWPAGDLGLRKALSSFYADGRSLSIKPMSIKEARAMGERFAPFQNLSAQFLLAGARFMG
jgi:DNA-3-methyladenine glycosylase II